MITDSNLPAALGFAIVIALASRCSPSRLIVPLHESARPTLYSPPAADRFRLGQVRHRCWTWSRSGADVGGGCVFYMGSAALLVRVANAWRSCCLRRCASPSTERRQATRYQFIKERFNNPPVDDCVLAVESHRPGWPSC